MTLLENKTPASRLYFQLLKLLLLSVFISASAIAAPTSTVTITELQNGLDHPWSLAFLPDNEGILITERSGQL
ncbi:PQQ-dependent sugar dehydrogenase, partial [Yersinia enterocolitica]